MTTPINPDVDTVRLLADVNSTDWPDASVQSLLDLQGGAVKLAAADLLEVLAGRITDVETDQVKLTGVVQAKTLMARAAALRTQHYEQEGGDFYFDATDMNGCQDTVDTVVDNWFYEGGLI